MPVNLKDAESLVIGVLKGAIEAEKLVNLSHCVGDSGNVVKELDVAVQDFKAGGVKNILKLV